jgi:hypothetical protein
VAISSREANKTPLIIPPSSRFTEKANLRFSFAAVNSLNAPGQNNPDKTDATESLLASNSSDHYIQLRIRLNL